MESYTRRKHEEEGEEEKMKNERKKKIHILSRDPPFCAFAPRRNRYVQISFALPALMEEMGFE